MHSKNHGMLFYEVYFLTLSQFCEVAPMYPIHLYIYLNTCLLVDVEIRLTPRAKMVSGESRLPLILLLKH